ASSLAATWVNRLSSYSDANVTVGGLSNTSFSFFDALENFERHSIGRLGLRGYSNQSQDLRFASVASLDLKIPLVSVFRGLGTYPVLLRRRYTAPFAEVAFLPEIESSLPLYPSSGLALRTQFDFLDQVPVTASLEYRHGFKTISGGNQNQVVFLLRV